MIWRIIILVRTIVKIMMITISKDLKILLIRANQYGTEKQAEWLIF